MENPEVRVVERPRRRLAAFALLWVGLVAASVATWFLVSQMVAPFLVGLGLLLTVLTPIERIAIRGRLSIDEDGLAIDDRFFVERGDLRAGQVVPTEAGAVLAVEARGGALEIAFDDVEDARRALCALGLDASRSIAEFRIACGSRRAWQRRGQWVAGLVASAVMMLIAASLFRTSMLAPAILAFVPAMFVLRLATDAVVAARLTIGAGGISIRSMRRCRFVPLAAIADAQPFGILYPMATDHLVVVRLRDPEGRVLEELVVDRVPRGRRGGHARDSSRTRARAIVERIREAIAARRGSADVDPRALAREGRDAAAWIEHLRALVARRETFRDGPPPSVDALLALVEDTTAAPAARAAAATAASGSGEDARRRIRLAAEASAAPNLRVALVAAADDDLRALPEALVALERA